MLIAALFIISQKWKQPRCPIIDGWINNCGISIKKECYLAIKKE